MPQKERKEAKKRLVELITQSYTTHRSKWEVELFEDFMIQKEIPKLVDDLIEGGVLVPPCKVGDVVYAMWYRPNSKEWVVQSSIVTGITFMKCDWFVETDNNYLHLLGSLLNKDWFTDHEAAEQALKERSNDKQ